MNKTITVSVQQVGRFVKAFDSNGSDWSKSIPQAIRFRARETGKTIESIDGGHTWSVTGEDAPAATLQVETAETLNFIEHKMANPSLDNPTVETIGSVTHIPKFVHTESVALKPKNFIISDLKWKYLVRSVLRGRNIMMTGPAGSGKTQIAYTIAKTLQRPHFYVNLGSTQDPRSTLIGNTHFSKENGTYFAQSLFVTAIQTPNSVILLDELSRAHPEAWNILMTVLDPGQRYLRLDEKDDSPTIKVADGVSFIATANIGNEFTATRTLDRALLDRFIIVEMEQLNVEQEQKLLHMLYPTVDKSRIKAIAEIAGDTRAQMISDNPKVSTAISTRMNVEAVSLLADGFKLGEVAEVVIYPFYSMDGGIDSERTYMKQLVQKYLGDEKSDEALFNVSADVATAF
jgi:nitric oxide reductase NorQ protein